MFDFVFVYFFSFGFILFYFFFQFVYFLWDVFHIQSKSVSNDLRIHWIPSSLVNFLDMINIMYFLSRVLGFHPKIAFLFIRTPSVSFYMDTIHFFLFGYHPFLFIRISSVSFLKVFNMKFFEQLLKLSVHFDSHHIGCMCFSSIEETAVRCYWC